MSSNSATEPRSRKAHRLPGFSAGYSKGNAGVRDIQMEIEPRAVTAIIGPSGCGKSTLLRSMNRMHELTAEAWVKGSIELDGSNLYGTNVDPVAVRRRVGMVFQRPNPFPTLSIQDNVAAGLKLNGIRSSDRDEIVERSLNQAALWDEVKDRLKQSAMGLSGGQQQRLCIARALAVNPEVLLMDEPASALDPIATARVEELIHELEGRPDGGGGHPQHAAGGPGLVPYRLPLHGRADRVR